MPRSRRTSCIRTRGKQGVPHPDPKDPPPVAGVVGRDSGRVYLEVLGRANRAELGRVVEDHTAPFSTVYTDEWRAYARLPELDRAHASFCHSAGEWARDDDGDGIREVHNNAMEGRWAGLRAFLRPFRGVSKWFLDRYVAVFQWACNSPAVGWDFIRAPLLTNFAP